MGGTSGLGNFGGPSLVRRGHRGGGKKGMRVNFQVTSGGKTLNKLLLGSRRDAGEQRNQMSHLQAGEEAMHLLDVSFLRRSNQEDSLPDSAITSGKKAPIDLLRGNEHSGARAKMINGGGIFLTRAERAGQNNEDPPYSSKDNQRDGNSLVEVTPTRE